jgi:hypothetical protein
MIADDRRMDVQQLAGLTDLELIVYAIREATMIVCTEIELGAATVWNAAGASIRQLGRAA